MSRLTLGCPSGASPDRTSLDERLLLLARTRGHTPARDRAVARFSRLGEHGLIWLAMGVAGATLDRERSERWRRMTRTIAGTYALNTAIKFVVRRPRPEPPGLPPLTSTTTKLSFPSAHASTSFAAAGLYRRLGLPVGPLYALAAALSLSRLYLGVHYPSDVLAGALLGSAVALSVELAHPLSEEARRLAADPADRADASESSGPISKDLTCASSASKSCCGQPRAAG